LVDLKKGLRHQTELCSTELEERQAEIIRGLVVALKKIDRHTTAVLYQRPKDLRAIDPGIHFREIGYLLSIARAALALAEGKET
jgi:hypothetical protein